MDGIDFKNGIEDPEKLNISIDLSLSISLYFRSKLKKFILDSILEAQSLSEKKNENGSLSLQKEELDEYIKMPVCERDDAFLHLIAGGKPIPIYFLMSKKYEIFEKKILDKKGTSQDAFDCYYDAILKIYIIQASNKVYKIDSIPAYVEKIAINNWYDLIKRRNNYNRNVKKKEGSNKEEFEDKEVYVTPVPSKKYKNVINIDEFTNNIKINDLAQNEDNINDDSVIDEDYIPSIYERVEEILDTMKEPCKGLLQAKIFKQMTDEEIAIHFGLKSKRVARYQVEKCIKHVNELLNKS